MKEEEAAVIVQRCVRGYLRLRKDAIKPSLDENDNNLEALPPKEPSLKLQARQVVEGVHLLHKKLQANLKKAEEMRELCSSIDEVSSHLKAITKLEKCKGLETSFRNGLSRNVVRERHREQINQINLKWWEKLDVDDNS